MFSPNPGAVDVVLGTLKTSMDSTPSNVTAGSEKDMERQLDVGICWKVLCWSGFVYGSGEGRVSWIFLSLIVKSIDWEYS